MHDEEEDDIHDDPQARRRALQDLRRQIISRVNASEDIVLLESLLEMIEDAESDIMEAERDPEQVEAAEQTDVHGKKKIPPPLNRPNQNTVDNWLDQLGR